MAEGFITLPPDSTGKKLRTATDGLVHQEVHTIADADGTLLVASSLAKEATLATVAAAYRRTKKHIEFIPSSAAPTTIYTGYAAPGTADSAAAWTIQRIVFTGATAIDETWTTVGTAVWDNRASETYT